MAPIKVAIVGTGMSTTVFHAPFLLSLPSLFTLNVIVERSATPEKSKARDAYPGVKVVNTLEQALEEDIDAVWILSINDTHYEYAKTVLNANKHAIVEKPITPTSSQAEELAQLAESKNLVLAVYQNRRWDNDFLTVKKLIDEGTFGELSEFESHFDRYKNVKNAKAWKEAPLPGAGAAYDLGSHLIDQILSLFGPPKSVTGLVRNSRLIGDESVPDSFQIQLHYPPSEEKGRKLPLLATARGSILSLLTPQQRFIIRGTNATFTKHGVDPQEAQLVAGGKDAIAKEEDYAVEPEALAGTLYRLEGKGEGERIISERGAYGKWFENVADAISSSDRSRLIVTPEQAALTIKIIELAEQSSREGRRIDL